MPIYRRRHGELEEEISSPRGRYVCVKSSCLIMEDFIVVLRALKGPKWGERRLHRDKLR